MAQPAEEPFASSALSALTNGIKAKKAMQETGETSVTATCPKCGGSFRYWLAGPKAHLRGKCFAKSCDLEVME